MDTQSPLLRFNDVSAHSYHQPRACASCARAKAKCVPVDDRKCERCLRLKKDCLRAEARDQPRKRRGTATSRTQRSHVEKLEEKLDGLVTLLKSTQQATVSTDEPHPLVLLDTSFHSPGPVSTPETSSRPLHEAIRPRGWEQLEDGSAPSLTPSLISDHQSAPRDATPTFNGLDSIVSKNIEITDEEADVLLTRFRTQMACFLPFLVIPPSLSAKDLKRDRPFLLKAICSVAGHTPNYRLALGKWLVEHLAERMAVSMERNLDLLLGALTHVGWFVAFHTVTKRAPPYIPLLANTYLRFRRSFHNCHNMAQMTLLLSLSMALVIDLGLNKPIPSDLHKSAFEVVLATPLRAGLPSGELPKRALASRTLEERRAFLGIFFITSSVSKFFRGRIEAPKVTPYVYECLEILDAAQAHPTDVCATSMIRLQIIVERISRGPWNTDYGHPENNNSGPPLRLYVKSLQKQLHDLRSAMPTAVSTQDYMLMHYYHAEERLYGVGLSRNLVAGDLSGHSFDRLEVLYDCLRSTRRFFETFFCIPESEYACFSTAIWIQISHSLHVLQSLSTFDHPDWDLASVRQEIDFVKVLGQVIERGNKVEGQIFIKATTRMAMVKAYFQEQMAVAGGGSRLDELVGQDADMGQTWEPLDFLDEQFFGDLLGMEF